MKISIITAAKNNKAGLIRAIESVRSQTYKNVEHIIVDGCSTDGSKEILRTEIGNQKSDLYSLVSISETDSGIYDAINKGIKLATGDVIGLLHSDDYYKDEFVLEKYAEAFTQPANDTEVAPIVSAKCDNVNAVYSDLVYVSSKTKDENRENNNSGLIENSELKIEHSVIRYWKTGDPSSSIRMTKWLENGWMPPHPTLFIRKNIFEKYGLYRTDMRIAADYEMVLRLFYKHRITASYLPHTTYCMTIGGASNKSVKNIILKSKEDFRAMKLHSLPNPVKTLFFKNISKLTQFIRR